VIETVTTGVLWFCAIGCGVLGGVYFAFSAFIMSALDRTGAAHAVAAMNAINTRIVRSLFMPLFLGTTLGSAVLAIFGLLDFPARTLLVAGGAVYVLGMFGVTMIWNVPLNDALAAAQDKPDAGAAWTRYRQQWTRWNHVRTVTSIGASALFVAALVPGCD
jgi:uncharacterized membrane protein